MSCSYSPPLAAPSTLCAVSADAASKSSAAVLGVSEAYEGVIDVYETKNKEIVKQVLFHVTVCSDTDTLRAAKHEQRMQHQLQQHAALQQQQQQQHT